jgi:ribosomal protein S21
MFRSLRSIGSSSRIPVTVRTYFTSGLQSQAAEVSRPQPLATNPFTSSEFPAPPPSLRGQSVSGSKAADSHAWWKIESQKRNGDTRIISKFHGRSLEIKRPGEFAQQYRALKRLINQTGLRKEVRLQEYYEKPSERRVRVASENHRKRFAAVVSSGSLNESVSMLIIQVREKVKLVELYRKRQ